MLEFLPLNAETASLAHAVYQLWVERVSYYFPIGEETFAHTLFAQPEVHPANFEMHPEASQVALEQGHPVGWIQAGYVSGLRSIPDGECDALVRCLMVAPGSREAACALLDQALNRLTDRKARAWQAFEHSSGYTFATGIGKAPHKMTEVVELLAGRSFRQEDTNLVYVTEALQPLPPSKNLADVEPEILPKGWSEPGAGVLWDQFNFTEHGEKVGYATVVPVGRLTGWPGEDTLFVKGIAVEDNHHRRGIGNLIMQVLWDYYQSQGIRRIILNTADDNFGAQKFYEAIGFQMPDRVSALLATEISAA